MTKVTKSTKTVTVNTLTVQDIVNDFISNDLPTLSAQTLAAYIIEATEQEIVDLPKLTIEGGEVKRAKKRVGNGTLRFTEKQQEIVKVLENATKLIDKQDFVQVTGLEHRDILGTIKALRNPNRPAEQRVIMHIVVKSGKVYYKYVLASRANEFGVEVADITDANE